MSVNVVLTHDHIATIYQAISGYCKATDGDNTVAMSMRDEEFHFIKFVLANSHSPEAKEVLELLGG